jgi:capsule polysaccharide export protein KpsE/RkpR
MQIEQSELEEIGTLRNNLATVVSDAGQTALQIKLLEIEVEELKKQLQEQTQKFKELLGQEQILIKRLSEKYGVGAINFETGEFTPEN